MDTTAAVAARSITPEQELQVLKLIINLRNIGDVVGSEKLRNRVRAALLDSEDDATAIAVVEELVRRAVKLLGKLDGSHEAAREKKRLRKEEAVARAARFVDAEAETGDDDEEPAASAEDEDVS